MTIRGADAKGGKLGDSIEGQERVECNGEDSLYDGCQQEGYARPRTEEIFVVKILCAHGWPVVEWEEEE